MKVSVEVIAGVSGCPLKFPACEVFRPMTSFTGMSWDWTKEWLEWSPALGLASKSDANGAVAQKSEKYGIFRLRQDFLLLRS
jgi:hypothetical protein